MIHPLSDIKTKKIGSNTSVWQYAIILEGASIGSNCNINCHTFIENDVVIGNNVTVKSGVYLWDGIRVGDNVFIGPNVTFTNDKYPRSKVFPQYFQSTNIESFVSIGAGAIILGGINIGQYSLIGAGTVVTKNVPSNALVVGNPGRVVAYLDDNGEKLVWDGEAYISTEGKKYFYEKLN